MRRRMMMDDRIVSAQGESVSLTDVKGSRLNGLSVYGRSWQDGAPSLDNPVEIQSVGDGGSVGVTVQGGNLLSMSKKGEFNGVSYVLKDGIATFEGQTATSSANRVNLGVSVADLIKAGHRYYAKTFTSEASVNIAVTKDGSLSYVSFFDADGTETRVHFRVMANGTNNVAGLDVDVTAYVALAENLELSKGEPPKPLQSITLQTPGGLPGIPVSSGGNYTDSDGQQWVCDEIDLARGVYIQRVQAIDSYSGESVSGEYLSTTGELSEGAKVLCILPAPIETPLTTDQTQVYKALHTYTPNTIITSDAWVKVGYREKR